MRSRVCSRTLSALKPLRLPDGFAERVISVAVPSTVLGGDVLEQGHLTAEALVDYLDAALMPVGRKTVERHLAACASCRDLEQEWAQVFKDLGSVARLAPPDDFRARVMAAVPQRSVIPPEIASRLAARRAKLANEGPIKRWIRAQANQLVARVSNRGRGRWAVVAGLGTAPAAVAASVAWVVLSHPLVTVSGLARFAWLQATQIAATLGGAFFGGLMESAATYQLWVWVQALIGTPLVAIAGAAALCAVLSTSVWVLFRNLGPVYRNLIPIRVMNGRYARANV